MGYLTTVVEMNPYSEKTKEMVQRSPEFFNKALKFLEGQVTELKRLGKRSEYSRLVGK